MTTQGAFGTNYHHTFFMPNKSEVGTGVLKTAIGQIASLGRKKALILLIAGLFANADAHAGLMDPPPWFDAGGNFFPKGNEMTTCAALRTDVYPNKNAWGPDGATHMGLNCYWFQNFTFVPKTAEIKITGTSEFATYGVLHNYDRLVHDRFPWSAPG